MIMRDYIEDIILDGEFPKLEEAKMHVTFIL